MSYSVEFQLAGLIIVSILCIMFFSKPRSKTLQNRIFMYLMLTAILELVFDIVSVITIDHRDSIPLVNTLFAKGYILVMQAWIAICVLYALSNFMRDDMSAQGHRAIKASVFLVLVPLAVCWMVSILTPLYYAGHGRELYSYGIPSRCTYLYSVYCVVFVIIGAFFNFRSVPLKRNVPMLSFVIMEGLVAVVQMYFPTLLIVGFGSAICVLIMYLMLENPDADRVAQLTEENRRAEAVLFDVFSPEFARNLLASPFPVCQIRRYENVSCAFLNLLGFSGLFSVFGEEKLIAILNDLVSEVDKLTDEFKVEKISSFGDLYLVASGLPGTGGDSEDLLRFLVAVQQCLAKFNVYNGTAFRSRIGVSCGSAVLGVIGIKKRSYNLWGRCVHMAARMESYGVADRIHVSEEMYEKLKNIFKFTPLETVDMRGFGKTNGYLLESGDMYTPPSIPAEAFPPS